MASKKALIVTAVGGFLQKFEEMDVNILQLKGYQIHYASNFDIKVYEYDQKWFKDQKIVLHHVPFSKSPTDVWNNVKAYCEIKRIIKQEKIDLVHCHNPISAAITRLAAAHCRIRPIVLYTAHGFHFYRGASLLNNLIFGAVEKECAKYTDYLITINHEDQINAHRYLKLANSQVFRIPGVGVDLERFRYSEWSYKKAREALAVSKEAFHIVSAGEMNRNKNYEVIIRAIALLKDKSIRYSICGNDSVNGNMTELKRLVYELKLDEQVFFMGYREDMEMVLQSADLFAFPSLREGLGMAAVEALASGVPLVCGDNRGTREYAVDDYNSIICRNNDVREYADAIHKLKQCGIESMRINCRKTSELFSLQNAHEIMLKAYTEADECVCKRGEANAGGK